MYDQLVNNTKDRMKRHETHDCHNEFLFLTHDSSHVSTDPLVDRLQPFTLQAYMCFLFENN